MDCHLADICGGIVLIAILKYLVFLHFFWFVCCRSLSSFWRPSELICNGYLVKKLDWVLVDNVNSEVAAAKERSQYMCVCLVQHCVVGVRCIPHWIPIVVILVSPLCEPYGTPVWSRHGIVESSKGLLSSVLLPNTFLAGTDVYSQFVIGVVELSISCWVITVKNPCACWSLSRNFHLHHWFQHRFQYHTTISFQTHFL